MVCCKNDSIESESSVKDMSEEQSSRRNKRKSIKNVPRKSKRGKRQASKITEKKSSSVQSSSKSKSMDDEKEIVNNRQDMLIKLLNENIKKAGSTPPASNIYLSATPTHYPMSNFTQPVFHSPAFHQNYIPNSSIFPPSTNPSILALT